MERCATGPWLYQILAFCRVKIAIGDDDVRETTYIIGEIRIYSPIVTEDTTSESMLESIEGFIDAGLFQPSTTPYSTTLHAIVSGGSEIHPPYRPHENLLQKSNHDSFDHKYHRNQILVISDMIPIWAQSWLHESCGHVERYLDSLMDWFEQTKRSGSPTQCVPAFIRIRKPHAQVPKLIPYL